MATVKRRTTASVKKPTLEKLIFSQAYEFEFDQAIRLLEVISEGTDLLGEGEDPRREPLVIKTHLSQATPASELQAINENRDQYGRAVLSVNFIGLIGHQGPLPQPYTNMITERVRHRDTAARDFVDIFNHRIASLWHRVQKKTRVGMAMIKPKETPIGKSFLDLVGLESRYLHDRLGIPDRCLLGYAALLWQRPRSVEGLDQLLETHFGTKVKITQFKGRWQHGRTEDWSRIGQTGQFHTLGKTAVLGKRSWNQGAGIHITLGPVKWDKYLDLLPGESGYKALRELVYFYTGLEYEAEIEVIVDHRTIPGAKLNGQYGLGLTTWLKNGGQENPSVRLRMPFGHDGVARVELLHKRRMTQNKVIKSELAVRQQASGL